MLPPTIVGPAIAEDRAQSYIGKRLAGRYHLESLIGLGGMSSVFRATDLEGKSVAVKILYPELLDSEAGQRFERESKVVQGLSHPHVVSTLSSGRDEALNAHFLVMPLLDGRDMDSVLEEQGALAPESAVRIALQAGRGLSAAHRVGIVHRDVKPGNLLLDRDGAELIVKVCDFGIAKRASVWGEESLTATGSQLGTPDYAAPEQLRNAKEADERADIWGLGATLYQMLCGVAPFSHIESVADLIIAICNEDVPHIQDRAPWIEAGLARAVHKALNRDPNLRPATVEDFADRLRRFSGGDELLDESRVTRVSSEIRKRVEGRADLALSVVQPPPAGATEVDPLGLNGKSLSGKYRVLRLIGKGGMGSVYEVEASNGQRLAAKVVSAGMANASPTALERFAREARTASDISSANVARTVDTGSDDALGMPYIIMELLHGVELSAVLKKEGALDPQVAVRLVLQGASGVAAAHASGVIHRDIKPANLFLQVDDVSQQVTVKVCDFGVAKRTRVNEMGNAVSHLSLTRTGGMLGSPMYMSPEQAKNAKAVDERTDVWSLSVVLWEALSGQRLWGGQTSLGELIIAICTEPIPQLEAVAPWVPRDLARVVHRGLERDPALRPSSVRVFIESLSVFTGGTDRVQKSQLVKMTDAERGALQVRVSISASAAAGIANLARGGRGGTSLPPERHRRSGRPTSQGNSWIVIALMIVVIGSLSVALGYLLHKR
ncbi:MAG TPA: serine/threonine-protein kinase [Polyangiaceae bacterium]|jgi:serine/threonine protein kinase|nr:serine/threonine-protein kinase [Polyangiaceae bacterium]